MSFDWNYTSLQCELNCSLVTNSTGRRIGPAECECIQNNRWDSTVGSCIANCSSMPHGVYSWAYMTCVPNCSSISNTLGDLFKLADNWYACPCANGFTWNNVTMECSGEVTPICPIGSQTACKCSYSTALNTSFQANFVWNPTTQSCECPRSITCNPTTQAILVKTAPLYEQTKSRVETLLRRISFLPDKEGESLSLLVML